MVKRKWFLTVLLSTVIITGFFILAQSSENVFDNIKLFSEVFNKIEDEYVEEVSSKKLIYGALKGMVGTLDPFSSFMDTTTYREVKVHTQGEFGGIGIKIAIKDEWLTVITPIPGTPAYRLGILPEDKIIRISTESTKGITSEEAVQKLRGKPGTEVNITVYREGEPEPLEFKIIREMIKIETVLYRELEDKIGYIKLLEFSEKTPLDLDKALNDLIKKDIKSLVLDLRNNPGGLLDSAVSVSRFFIGGEKLIVYTQGRDSKMAKRFNASPSAKYPNLPMCILINKGSASGSEIVAGCMKDHKRAIILGETSFGKASVQSIIQLSDGSALRLTTAHYYTPNGTLIHEKGINPNIAIDVPREIQIKLMAQEDISYPGLTEKKAPDSESKKNDTKEIVEQISKKDKKSESKKVEDTVLERAKDILKAREIFSFGMGQSEPASKP